MASRKDAFKRAMARYLGEGERRGLSAYTLTNYGGALRRVHRILVERDQVRGPTRIGEEQARIIHEEMGHSPQLMRLVHIFLRAHGNDILHRLGLLRPPGPPNVRWLDLDHGEDLLVADTATQMGPPWSTLIHLELKLLFRRISCIRARLGHFRTRTVTVHGKGALYAVSPHPDTEAVLRRHESWRQAKGVSSDALFVTRFGRPYREGSKGVFDRWLQDVERESGVRIGGHHTLRRTGGRKLWIAGVPLETVSHLLGHASIDMTIRYLGINISDMAEAHRRLVEYEASQRLIQVKDANFRPSGMSQSSESPL